MSELQKLYDIEITGAVEEINNARMVGVAWRDCRLIPAVEKPEMFVRGKRVSMTIFGLQGFPSLWTADQKLRQVVPHVETDTKDGQPVTEWWADLTGNVIRYIGLSEPALAIPMIKEISGPLSGDDILKYKYSIVKGESGLLILASLNGEPDFIVPTEGPSGISHGARPQDHNNFPQWSFIWKTVPI